MQNEFFIELKMVTDRMFRENPIEEHPLFQMMRNDEISMEQQKEASLQIYHVVRYFPRFLSAILTNIPDYQLRMPLVENLFEEHGRMSEKHVHEVTYKQFLFAMGLSEEEILRSEPIVPVIAYNRSMKDLCLHYPFEEGLAALGVIEEIVARVSPIVGSYAAKKFQGKGGSLIHFADHEVLDITHANEIYEVVSFSYQGDSKKRVERGLQLGMYYHRRLYSDIVEHLKT